MIGKRCQVCDGPVVNGRCKLCGMPYRDDEIMYHLNENRRDHYRHSSARVQRAMRRQEIPLGDKTEPDRQQRKSHTSDRTVGKSMRSNMPAGAETRKTPQTSTAEKTGTGRTMQSDIPRRAQRTEAGKKGKPKVPWGVIVLVLTVFLGIVPGLVELAENVIYEIRYEDTYVADETPAMMWISQGEAYTVEEGEYVIPGTYNVYADEGAAEIRVLNNEGMETYSIAGEDSISLVLQEGDRLEVLGAENEDAAVFLEFDHAMQEL